MASKTLVYSILVICVTSALCKNDERDSIHMKHAIRLASQAIGKTSPNPCVGCVIVDQNGLVVGEGWHKRAGEAHAEVNALKEAGERAAGGTAYVSLEPCNHFGRTPPCTHALIRQGIARVVAGVVDPDPRVSGTGLEYLKEMGVEVQVGVEETLCKAVNSPFIFRVLHKKPYVVLLLSAVDLWRSENATQSSDNSVEDVYAMMIGGVAPEVDTLLLNDHQLHFLTVLQDDPAIYQNIVIDALREDYVHSERQQQLLEEVQQMVSGGVKEVVPSFLTPMGQGQEEHRPCVVTVFFPATSSSCNNDTSPPTSPIHTHTHIRIRTISRDFTCQGKLDGKYGYKGPSSDLLADISAIGSNCVMRVICHSHSHMDRDRDRESTTTATATATATTIDLLGSFIRSDQVQRIVIGGRSLQSSSLSSSVNSGLSINDEMDQLLGTDHEPVTKSIDRVATFLRDDLKMKGSVGGDKDKDSSPHVGKDCSDSGHVTSSQVEIVHNNNNHVHDPEYNNGEDPARSRPSGIRRFRFWAVTKNLWSPP
eukprot:gene8176-16801_t